MANTSLAPYRTEIGRRVHGVALRLNLHPNMVRRYRRILDVGLKKDWMERICLIRATRHWTYDLYRRERIAAAIITLAKGLAPPVYAAWADPELFIANDPREVIKFVEEQPGAQLIAVSEVLEAVRGVGH